MISSFAEEEEDVQVVAIYKDATGKVLGGESTLVEFVPAGGRAPFDISTYSQFDAAIATTDLYAFAGFSPSSASATGHRRRLTTASSTRTATPTTATTTSFGDSGTINATVAQS